MRPDLYSEPTTRAPIQRKGADAVETPGAALPASGSGTAMPAGVRAKMESAFGADFSAVRVHQGSEADSLGALAYTQGTDIHFASGQYDPDSMAGQALLGHELTHVVQQSQGRVQATTQAKGAAINDDSSLEREADELGARAARGEPVAGASSASASSMPARSGTGGAVQLKKKGKNRGKRQGPKPDKKEQRRNKREQELLRTLGPNTEQRGSKHDRKKGRANKLAMSLEEQPMPLEPSVDVELDDELDSELDDDTQFELDDELDERDDPPEPDVPMNVIGEEFSQGLKSQGLHPFLSGGAAITFHGGPRPAGDLDFRITMEDAGFSSFNEPRGQAVLQYINQVMLRNSRLAHKTHGAVANAFNSLGPGALTIGTPSWFGVEVSLSLVYFEPTELVSAKDVDPDNPDIDILSLEDLRADKLKSLVTRRKSGVDSIGKIAKDLFDFLAVSWMIHKQSFQPLINVLQAAIKLGEEMSEEMEGKDLLATATTLVTLAESWGAYDTQELDVDMSHHLDEAASGKLGEYGHVNHDGRAWHDASPTFVRDIMKTRAVMTARVHTDDGKRRDAFLELVEKMRTIAEQKHDDKALTLLDAMPDLLDQLAEEPAPKKFSKPLSPWFEAWNEEPNFAPPKPFKRLTGPSLGPKEDVTGEEMAFRPAEDILSDVGESFLDDAFEPMKKQPSSHEKSVIRVLVVCDGFRPLRDGYTHIDTFLSFGMSKSKFDDAWKRLSRSGYVRPANDGLHLTDKGREVFMQ